MKRKGYLFERVADIDNLRTAFCKARKRKSAKTDILEFSRNLDANLSRIRRELLDGTYRFGAYSYFDIHDPKRRVICAASFPERVIHHAIMNICAEHFENYQIPYSYARRKNKGTFAALERAARCQRKYQWHLKLDVRKYFDSISHEILYGKMERMYKDRKLLDVFRRIIDSYHARDGKGVPIGNLTSQYFANHYLSFADRYAVEKLRIPAYVRYMDDMFMWANNGGELREKGALFEKFIVENLGLSLKPFVLNRTKHGLSALGFILYPNAIRLNQRSRERFSVKLTEYMALMYRGEMRETEFSRRVLAIYGFIARADARGFAGKILRNWVERHGLEPGESGRELEQRREERAGFESQQQRSRQSQQQYWFPPGPQLKTAD